MNTISISRRRFAQLLGAGAAVAVVRPALSFAGSPEHVATPAVVRLSANENPYGPSPIAFKAMSDTFNLASRYPDEHNNALIDKLAKINAEIEAGSRDHRLQLSFFLPSQQISPVATERSYFTGTFFLPA